MRGSSFTTFLVFLPLIAIPVLAVFGIPEFQPVNASSPTEFSGGDIKVRDLESAAAKQPPGESEAPAKPFSGDVFKSPDLPPSFDSPAGSTASASRDSSNSDPFLNDSPKPAEKSSPRMKGWKVDPVRYLNPRSKNGADAIRLPPRKPRPRREPAPRENEDGRGAAPFPGTSSRDRDAGNAIVNTALKSEPKSERRPLPTTLHSVVARLRELGIRDYVLRPGTRNGEFYFRCSTPPQGRNRISVKFEQEDPDPLRAAQKVLAQVEARRGMY